MADDVNGKLDTLIDEVRDNSEKLDSIETLLIGDVKDTNKVGILERLRNVERWIEKREWFEKLIIVAIVGNAIGLIFVLIQNVLNH